MGFGCNACGVTGCRIIDSPRERLIAILTNSFAPCNGRFPLLIFLCAVFFDAGSAGGALLLTGVIAGSVLLTLAASRLLSAFFLRGLPSSFVLELPPYRAPQPGRVIVRSVLDRTVFVLGRAMIVAAPAGALIWLLANITVSGSSLYGSMTAFLDPFGRFFGLDGVILAAFLLGFPANELVMPLIVLGYLSGGTLADVSDLLSFRALLLANGSGPAAPHFAHSCSPSATGRAQRPALQFSGRPARCDIRLPPSRSRPASGLRSAHSSGCSVCRCKKTPSVI